MKVCTDACLFGAFVANETANEKLFRILDIGTGTGLLSLMLAQKSTANIDSIEIDTAACEQAKENIAASPWKEKITTINADITTFNSKNKYDLIISNPPFFEGDLQSANEQKNAAKHDAALTLEQLLVAANNNLNKEGIFAVLLPYHRVDYFIKESAAKGLYLTNRLLVKQAPTHNFFRGILIFSKTNSGLQSNELSIKDNKGNYTGEFTGLLKDYYLYL